LFLTPSCISCVLILEALTVLYLNYVKFIAIVVTISNLYLVQQDYLRKHLDDAMKLVRRNIDYISTLRYRSLILVHRIIITGGSGFIGRHLVKRLLSSKGATVVLISSTTNLHDKYLSERKLLQDMPLTFYTAYVRDRESILNIFLNERPDICIHLAAKTGLVELIGKTDETMDINVKGTLNVLEACHYTHVNNFVFAYSAAVYGNVRQLPIKEDHTLKPLSTYGTSTMLAEQHIASYQRSKKIHNAISLRIFSAYGNGQSSEADVITRFAVRLSRGLSPVIYGDGLQTRDFISVDDVVESILLSMRTVEETEDINPSLPLIF
jgi:UDP-glucose 4-epimerase